MKWTPIIIIAMVALGQPVSSDLAQATETREAVCFVYHRFGDSRYPTTNITAKDFEAHLQYLLKNDFQVLSFSEAIDYLRSTRPFRKTAVITIDDGYKSFFKNGLPLLKKYNVPATLFINTKTVGGGDYMNWDELEEAMKHKVEIGNHTHSHDYFLNLPEATRYETFKDEIELSQTIIKKNLQIEPTIFSYPYGEFDSRMKEIAKRAGFVAAAAQNSGVISQYADFFQCPRFPMSEAYASKEQFAEKASMHSLQIVKQSPGDFMLGQQNPPVLTLTLSAAGLNLKQFQCFVQGGECDVQIQDQTEKSFTVKLQARRPFTNRRRTLYTVTVRDNKGGWHWFSHLWINSRVLANDE